MATFFLYKGVLVDLNKEIMKKDRGTRSLGEVCEAFRKELVLAMKTGAVLAINMDHFIPDFKVEYNKPEGSELFDTESIFNFEHLRVRENYKKILKDEEDYDFQGNRGCFYMNPDFQICMIYTHKAEDHTQKVIESLPSSS